jgi:hypothetical protein
MFCGLLNGDVDTFVVLNFKNKSRVSCALHSLLSVKYRCLPLSRALDSRMSPDLLRGTG